MKNLIGKKNLIMSAIALLLIAVMVAGVSYSWTEGGNKGNVQGNDIVISAGSSLIMRQNDKVTNSIIIPAGTLEETSSADGRNFFFPLVSNKENTTSDMVFREGIPADENKRYVSVDFELQAGDKETPVYLGAGTIIQCKNAAVLNALRMSFNLNNGTDPIVFKPNQMPGITEAVTYSPITAITGAGAATTGTTATEAYGDFYFKGENDSTPLFSLNKNETFNITLTLWLEGTEFSGNDISDSELSVFIDFTTTVDDLIKYTFIDNCHSKNSGVINNWVDDNIEDGGANYPTMMYLYDYVGNRYYALEKSVEKENTWVGYIPKTIKDFYFRRYSIDINQWWNEWEPSIDNIPTINNERKFIAIAGSKKGDTGEELSGCYGYWDDGKDTIRVYFQMECGWNDPHCYAWTESNSKPLGIWPGEPMKEVQVQENSILYYVDIPDASKLHGIQFNNGNKKTIVYFETDYGFEKNFAYAWIDSPTKELLGAWPGTGAEWDAGLGMNRVYIGNGTDDVDAEFKIIHNIGDNSTQVTANNTGEIGKSYIFHEGSSNYLEEIKLEINITDTEYFFNGMRYYYKNSQYKGHNVYLDAKDSLIYPENVPSTETN